MATGRPSRSSGAAWSVRFPWDVPGWPGRVPSAFPRPASQEAISATRIPESDDDEIETPEAALPCGAAPERVRSTN